MTEPKELTDAYIAYEQALARTEEGQKPRNLRRIEQNIGKAMLEGGDDEPRD